MDETLKNLKNKCTFKGNLHTYRFCDNVWTFILEDAEFKFTGPGKTEYIEKCPRVKIVACDGKNMAIAGGASGAGPSGT